MVKCTNGLATFSVTEGAYDSYFKPLGYRKMNNPDKNPMQDGVNEDEADELTEKPISQWTKMEVKEFAEKHGIDISGTKNVGQAKEIIKEWLGN